MGSSNRLRFYTKGTFIFSNDWHYCVSNISNGAFVSSSIFSGECWSKETRMFTNCNVHGYFNGYGSGNSSYSHTAEYSVTECDGLYSDTNPTNGFKRMPDGTWTNAANNYVLDSNMFPAIAYPQYALKELDSWDVDRCVAFNLLTLTSLVSSTNVASRRDNSGSVWTGITPNGAFSNVSATNWSTIQACINAMTNGDGWYFPCAYTNNMRFYVNYSPADEITALATIPCILSNLNYSSEWRSGQPKAVLKLYYLDTQPSTSYTTGFYQETDNTITVSKFQYRFRFSAKKDEPFRFTYRVVTYPNNEATNYLGPRYEWRTISGIGTGKEMIISHSGTNGTGEQLEVKWDTCPTFTSNGFVEAAEAFKVIELPCGYSSSECVACDSRTGACSASAGGVHININLGPDRYGTGKSALTINWDGPPSPELFTPAVVTYSGNDPAAQVPRDLNTGIINNTVSTSHATASIVSNSETSFRIIETPPSSRLSSSYADLAQTASNQLTLIVTSKTDTAISVTTNTWTYSNNAWSMVSPGGLKRDIETWNTNTLVRTNLILDASGNIASQTINTYYQNGTNGLFLINTVRGSAADPTGALLSDSWIYYDNPINDGINFGRVKWERPATGGWAYYEYLTNGLIFREIHQFRDLDTNDFNQCRIIAHYYTNITANAVSSETVIESIGTQEVSRHYSFQQGNKNFDIQALTPGAAWNDTNNTLATTTTYTYVGNERRPVSISNPDGTMQIFSYRDYGTDLRTTNCTGQPNQSGTAIISGRMTVTCSGSYGVSSVSSYDIAAGVAGVMLSSTSYSYDDYGRPWDTYDHLLNTSTTRLGYNCCGIDSMTEVDGTTINYGYDVLKRRNMTTANGITTSNKLDAVGNVLSSKRNGMLIQTNLYDSAGRLYITGDGQGHNTTNYYDFDSSNHYLVKTTNADGGTVITTYYRDGQVYQIGGTAAHPVRYEYGVDTDGNRYTTTIKLDNTGGTNEWETTYTDMAGRYLKTVYSSAVGAHVQNVYNTLGQLSTQTDPDGITTTYQYNGKGELEGSFVTNRATYTVRSVLSDDLLGGFTRTQISMTNDFNGVTPISASDVFTNGNTTRTITWNADGSTSIETFSKTIYLGYYGVRPPNSNRSRQIRNCSTVILTVFFNPPRAPTRWVLRIARQPISTTASVA